MGFQSKTFPWIGSNLLNFIIICSVYIKHPRHRLYFGLCLGLVISRANINFLNYTAFDKGILVNSKLDGLIQSSSSLFYFVFSITITITMTKTKTFSLFCHSLYVAIVCKVSFFKTNSLLIFVTLIVLACVCVCVVC